MLNLLVTHLPAEQVDRNVAYLQAVAPGSRFAVCHGGRREDFDGVRHPEKLFIEDPSLRGPWMDQSYNEVLVRAHDEWVAGDPSVDAVFLFEFDQVILRGDFEQAFTTLLDASGADFLGKNCADRDRSNWMHAVRARRDTGFTDFLRSFSVHGERRPRLYGALGGGFVMRRAALEAFRGLDHPRGVYLEIYTATVLHHLGFRVEDIDRVSDIYDEVVHGPVKTLDEVIRAKREGHFFAHPFKDIDRLDDVLTAPGSSSDRYPQPPREPESAPRTV